MNQRDRDLTALRSYFCEDIASVLTELAQARSDWIECLIAVGASFGLDASDIGPIQRIAISAPHRVVIENETI